MPPACPVSRYGRWNCKKTRTEDNIETTKEQNWANALQQKSLIPSSHRSLYKVARMPAMLRWALRQQSPIFRVAGAWIKPLSFPWAPASEYWLSKQQVARHEFSYLRLRIRYWVFSVTFKCVYACRFSREVCHTYLPKPGWKTRTSGVQCSLKDILKTLSFF